MGVETVGGCTRLRVHEYRGSLEAEVRSRLFQFPFVGSAQAHSPRATAAQPARLPPTSEPHPQQHGEVLCLPGLFILVHAAYTKLTLISGSWNRHPGANYICG